MRVVDAAEVVLIRGGLGRLDGHLTTGDDFDVRPGETIHWCGLSRSFSGGGGGVLREGGGDRQAGADESGGGGQSD